MRTPKKSMTCLVYQTRFRYIRFMSHNSIKHTLCLVGTPNVGKTTLFNLLTGQNAATTNASGTTVSMRKGIATAPNASEWEVVDMPGIYSKQGQKGEERLAWEEIVKYKGEEGVVFLQVIDPGQWRHSLAITLDLQQHGINPLLFFNTKDGDAELGETYYAAVESNLQTAVLQGNIEKHGFAQCFWEYLLESQEREYLLPVREFAEDKARFEFIEHLFAHTVTVKTTESKWALFLDRMFLHSLGGIVIFLAIMWAVFHLTFTLGALPMDWIDRATAGLQNVLSGILGAGFLARLFIDGLITGVGGTIIFLPNILILFFFLSLMQQSGYLARTSYIFDVFFKKVGISGKASVHLLMGFGCNVPSVMATKSLEGKKEKVIVSMMTLFMSCSARLPVYTLLIAAFVPMGYQGVVLFGVYLTGIVVSFSTGWLLHSTYKGKRQNKLLAAMPSLQLPSLKKALRFAGFKGKVFLIRVGKFIVPASIVLWLLFTFPSAAVESEGIGASYGAKVAQLVEPVFAPLGFDWRVTAGILSGLGAKEVMVATFAALYDSSDNPAELGSALRTASSFSLPVALALLVFTLIYTPCVAALGAIRAEVGTYWMIFAIFYPTILAWILAFCTYRIALLF